MPKNLSFYILIVIICIAAVLRFYKLASVPPSLYWDEASLGYNAYSILKTLHDEHGKFLPLTNFAAFGDYKPPGYIYATVPSIAIFGLNEFATRFPSAFFGVLTVILTYFLTKKLFSEGYQKYQKYQEYQELSSKREKSARGTRDTRGTLDTPQIIALLAALFLTISPWHLQFSRGAFEANLGLFFSVLGIWLFLKFAQDNSFWILPSALSFLAGMYTFTGQRLFVPFILLVLAIQFRKQILAQIKIVVATALIAAILFWPLFVFATQTIEGRLRFDEVTIFKDLEPINQSIRFRQRDNFSWLSNIIHNRRLFYSYEYLTHYFDAFNPSFLFTKGDVNPRLSIQEVGELYYIDLLLVLAGVYFLFATKQKYRFLIITWLLISPLGPATARETPHALRMIHILPTFQILAAYGFFQFYKFVKFKKFFLVLTFLLLSLNFFFYLHMYYVHWPRNYSGEWQFGYKEAVEFIKLRYNDVDYVVVTKAQGRPYIYFLLYMQFNPREYWKSVQITKDKFFFINVDGFDKLRFTDSLTEASVSGRVLYVVLPNTLPPSAQKLKTITRLDGTSVFDIGEAEIR